MDRTVQQVPYGYEPPQQQAKGCLIYYDSFENTSEAQLDAASHYARQRAFAKLVLYPIHEATARRMSNAPVSAYYKRVERLQDWKRMRDLPFVSIEGFEGSRKKYTPIDLALRHLSEHYPAPHFLYLTSETAERFASYDSFDTWIVKLRLLITSPPSKLHPKLELYRHRWEAVSTP